MKKPKLPPPSNEMCIKSFFHCKRCLTDKPGDISPRDYAMLEVGWTELGMQVWCKRHEANIIHISFEGQKHLANTSRSKKKT
jgi:hypothetical protein